MSSAAPVSMVCKRCNNLFVSFATTSTNCPVCKHHMRVSRDTGYIGQSLIIWTQNHPEIAERVIKIASRYRWVHCHDVVVELYRQTGTPLKTTHTGKPVEGKDLKANINRVTHILNTRPDIFQFFRRAKNGNTDSMWLNLAWREK